MREQLEASESKNQRTANPFVRLIHCMRHSALATNAETVVFSTSAMASMLNRTALRSLCSNMPMKLRCSPDLASKS